MQAVVAILWWFHPLIWYANRQIVRWREASCDEEVIARLAISPRCYADALLRVLESRFRNLPAMQIGMAVGESTEQRLVRLMNQTGYHRSTPIWCWIVALLASFVILPGAAWSWQTNDATDPIAGPAVSKPAAEPAAEPAAAMADLVVVHSAEENQAEQKTVQLTGRFVLVGKPVDSKSAPQFSHRADASHSRNRNWTSSSRRKDPARTHEDRPSAWYCEYGGGQQRSVYIRTALQGRSFQVIPAPRRLF